MSDTIIHAEKLSKRYQLAHKLQGRQYVALRDVITEKFKQIFRPRKNAAALGTREDFWALKDVSFEIKRGEVVGIIGRNGAGKSTLLKILSRITEPTEGRLRLRGRVASLLEVGTGFHPELTGRENIFLNGAILGMQRAEIKRKFDEIVAFAEVEKFLDTPVKRYSSGMYVRLAFAVAAHLEPEILVIDEVLAVGDADFQKKCLGKMREVSSGNGRTVLFVSHNMAAVSSLCQTGILLSRGQISYQGPVAEAVARYSGQSESTTTVAYAPSPTAPRITKIVLHEEALKENRIVLDIEFKSPFLLTPPIAGVLISSAMGIPVLGSNPRFHKEGYTPRNLDAGVTRVEFDSPPLRDGRYLISFWLGDWHQNYDQKPDAICFEWAGHADGPLVPSWEYVGHMDWPATWSLMEAPTGGVVIP